MEEDASDRVQHAANPDLPSQYSNNGFNFTPAQFSTGGPASIFVAVLPEAQNLDIVNWTSHPESLAEFYTGTGFGYDLPSGSLSCRLATLRTLTDPVTLECADGNTSFTPSSMYDDSTLLRCDLLNSSYSMKMSYLNGVQDIQVSTNRTGISPLLNGSDSFIGPDLYGQAGLFNCSPFLVYPYSDSTANPSPCDIDVSAVRLLSYQAIMTAFNQLILGDIRFDGQVHTVHTKTTILETVLGQTDELAVVRNVSLHPLKWRIHHDFLQNKLAGDSYQGLLNTSLPRTRANLKTTLEQSFQNFTVSLLSEPYFQ